MKAMIQALLRLSRVGIQGEEFVPTDCKRVLRQVLDDPVLTIEKNDAEVTHDPLPTVMADEAQMDFKNLIR
jgi:light-regulated signal transduction histidine kinase (bacteriophytochrome)